MSKSRDDQSSSNSPRAGASRRQLLLGGTAIFAVGALPTIAAQAQQPKRPNILVIMGDDIGQPNISAYTIGLMGYRTPNIDRIAKEGMMFTDYYAEQSCTAGRSSFITGQCTLSHRPVQGRHPGRSGRATSPRTSRSPKLLKAARLRHRPVRQEPPRRSQRVSADRPRLRRVLRQPLPPQRRGGAGTSGLPEGPRVQGRCSARAA